MSREPRLVQCKCGWLGTDDKLVLETPDFAHCPVCRAIFAAWPRQDSDEAANIVLERGQQVYQQLQAAKVEIVVLRDTLRHIANLDGHHDLRDAQIMAEAALLHTHPAPPSAKQNTVSAG